ncbi:MAG: hypothetical protein CMM01_04420 [Rhodopirellula sp.]|nr:hypothetical protein [Rhodopirellula sp.]
MVRTFGLREGVEKTSDAVSRMVELQSTGHAKSRKTRCTIRQQTLFFRDLVGFIRQTIFLTDRPNATKSRSRPTFESQNESSVQA